MSRVPRPAKSYSSLRPPATPVKLSTTPATPGRLRVPSPSGGKSRPNSPSKSSKPLEQPAESPKPRLSVKEQIALKRQEAKKAAEAERKKNAGGFSDTFGDVIDATPERGKKPVDEADYLGRMGVRETIERARSSGNLNLSSRSLPCVPSCLFDIHLGILPKPLDGVSEPEYPEDQEAKRNQKRQQPSWFEAQDLTVLKARNNEISAIQPELALFGSLKVIDLHSNNLRTLPDSLTILACLTTLDVSNNAFEEFPPALFSLPALTTLNVSNNKLTSLPFSKFGCKIDITREIDTGAFFQPEVSRSIEPLPSLHVLDASHNKLAAASIETDFLPQSIQRLMLAHNPLGDSSVLIHALSRLKDVQEIHMDHTDISNESFKSLVPEGFRRLSTLSVRETNVTESAIQLYFKNSSRFEDITTETSNAPPTPGQLRIQVGREVMKEPWEIEAEKRLERRKRGMNRSNTSDDPDKADKEDWEWEAEQRLATEGERRRARAAEASLSSKPSEALSQKALRPTAKVIEKEQWEVEAEQGLLTEGGRRRLRAQQAAKAAMQSEDDTTSPVHGSPSSISLSLSNSQYFTQNTQTLTLPASHPPTRSHLRAFSMLQSPQTERPAEDLLVPAPTFPLDIIVKHEFVSTLNVLNLSNRRADPSFSFPSKSIIDAALPVYGVLPRLTELSLDGCNLGDTVNVTYHSGEEGQAISMKVGLLEIIADTFPTLGILDLSYNAITSDGLSEQSLERLLVPGKHGRKGLTTLRLRGNRLLTLDAFEGVANLFRRNQSVEGWRFEELDVRDNEITKLPAPIGLIPMDVFLVDGNTFRVPPRKVWEREGTKGLLSWLRGRLD